MRKQWAAVGEREMGMLPHDKPHGKQACWEGISPPLPLPPCTWLLSELSTGKGS